MKSVSVGDLKRANSETIRKWGCFKVTYEGDLMGIWLAPLTDYAITQGEHVGLLTNIAGGIRDDDEASQEECAESCA